MYVEKSFAEATFSPGSDRTILIAGVIPSKESVTEGTVFALFLVLFDPFPPFLFFHLYLFAVYVEVSVRDGVVDPCVLFTLPGLGPPVVVCVSTSVASVIVTLH